MTTQTATQVRLQGRQGWRSLAGMTAATLILLGGVALWHGWPDAGRTSQDAVQVSSGSNSVVAVRPAEPVAGLSDQEQYSRWQAGGLGHGAPVETGAEDVAQSLYIVATEAEAAELRAKFESYAPVTVQYQVLVLDPAADDGQVLRGLGHMNEVRALTGLPSIELIDLRGPQVLTPAGDQRPTSHNAAAARPSAALMLVADSEMYQQWQATRVADGLLVVDQRMVSVQEMFSRWQ